MSQSLELIKTLAFILDPYTPATLFQGKLGQLEPQNWSELAELALHQRVSLRFYQTIGGSSKPDRLRTELHTQLKNAYLQNAVRNTLILHHAAQLLASLLDQNVETITLKGIYLIENVNRSIAERSFGDIDLLVKRSDLSAAMACARARGFEPSSYFEPADQDTDIKHVPPMFNKDGLPVEIHWTLLEEDEPFRIDIEGLWQRAQLVTVAGVKCLALSPEDLLAHLCLHLTYQHNLSLGLKGVLDVVDVLWRFKDQLDWDRFLAITRTWQCQRVIWLTFSLVKALSAAIIPEDVLTALQPARPEPWIIEQAIEQILEADPNRGGLTPDLATFSNTEGALAKIKIGLERVFLPRKIIARLYNLRPNSPEIFKGYFLRLKDLSRGYGKDVFSDKTQSPSWQTIVTKEEERVKLQSWLGSQK